MTDIDFLVNELRGCNINLDYIENVIVKDFRHLVNLYIDGEGMEGFNSLVFDPQPEIENPNDVREVLNKLGYGRGYLILNTEIEKEMKKRGLWNFHSKMLLHHNQTFIQSLVDYYIDLLEQTN